MGQQVGLLERRVVVRPISIVKPISKLTNSFTMMKFLAMFCLFIALFDEMEAKPIKAHSEYSSPANLQDNMFSERQDSTSEEAEAEEEDEDEREEEEEVEEEEEEDEDEGDDEEREEEEEVEEEEEQDEEDDHPHPPPPEDDDHPHPPPPEDD